MSEIRSTFEDQVFLNTVLIKNLTDGELGTGFLLQKTVGEAKTKILLFSNKHVFWGKKDKATPGVKKTVEVILHRKNEDGTYKLGTVVQLKSEIDRSAPGYFEHPDPEVDVACINISQVFNVHPIENRAISLEAFSNFDMNSLVVGQKILFVGYPQGFFDLKHHLPVARFGTIASIPSIDFNGEKQLLVDAPVYPGSSGSPVFFQHKDGTFKLLGIISSAPISEADFIDTGVTPTEAKKIAIKFFGLGILFKLETLKEVFNLA